MFPLFLRRVCIQNNEFGCREADYLVRYSLRLNVADDEGNGFSEHDFEFFNSLGNKIIESQTNEEGFSDYYLIDILSIHLYFQNQNYYLYYNP